MEIPILLVGINGRYKKNSKTNQCQPGQRKRYISMANMQKRTYKKQLSFEKGFFGVLEGVV